MYNIFQNCFIYDITKFFVHRIGNLLVNNKEKKVKEIVIENYLLGLLTLYSPNDEI